MPDDNSELVPPLPIPNRTVKRLSADDSAATSVKVGHRQANIFESPRLVSSGGFSFGATLSESMKFTGTERKVAAKKTVTEGFASKAQASTAPKKEIISESNELANRFKQLAGIIK